MSKKEKELDFNIIKQLVEYTINDLYEQDDLTMYRMGCVMNVDIDSLSEDEYENFIEGMVGKLKALKNIIEKSEKSFNKGMILFE